MSSRVSFATPRALEGVASVWRNRLAPSRSEHRSVTPDDQPVQTRGRIQFALEGFVAEAIEQQADSLEVTVEELVGFSVLYYLADVDSGRIAREIATSPHRDDSEACRVTSWRSTHPRRPACS
jgi:hypothetical protein